MVRTRAKAAATTTPPMSVDLPPASDVPASITDKRHCDFSMLAKGGAAKASKLRAKKQTAASSSAKSSSTTSSTETSKQARKQPPSTAKATLKQKAAESKIDDEESLDEEDSNTSSSSEDDTTTSDEEFIAPESDQEKVVQGIDSSSSSDSDDDDVSSADSDDDDSVQEVTPPRSKSKQTKTTAKGKRVVKNPTPSKKTKIQSESSAEEDSEDSSKVVTPSSAKSKASKRKVEAESESSEDDSDEDSSDRSEDKAKAKSKGSAATTTTVPSTPTTVATAPVTPVTTTATTPTTPPIGHGFMDAIFLTGANVVFVAAGKGAFKSNTVVIYVPDKETHFTVESLCTNTLVPGAFYYGAFDALGRLVNMQRVNVKDSKLPDLDRDWLIVPYAVLAITGGIVFTGVVSSVDPVQERQNRYGGISHLREISVVARDSTDPEIFHNVFCTLWGENTKHELKEKDVILIVNARQSSFQGIVRFTVADTSTITVISKLAGAKTLRKHAKKFIKKGSGANLVLPDGCQPWKE